MILCLWAIFKSDISAMCQIVTDSWYTLYILYQDMTGNEMAMNKRIITRKLNAPYMSQLELQVNV